MEAGAAFAKASESAAAVFCLLLSTGKAGQEVRGQAEAEA
jgi:hypothetical protein